MNAPGSIQAQPDLATIEDLADRTRKSVGFLLRFIRIMDLRPAGRLPPLNGNRWRRLYSFPDVLSALNDYSHRRTVETGPVAAQKPVEHDPHWRPKPSRAVQELSDQSPSRNLCPIMKIPCNLSLGCVAGENAEDGRKSGDALAAAEFCSNYVPRHAQSRFRCTACAKYKTAACAFDCFRVGHEKFIRSAFADSKRSIADKNEVLTCTT